MRRLVVSICLSVALVVGGVSGVLAKPAKGCQSGPGSEWQAFAVDLNWQLGDGVPAPGEDPWWDMTVEGMAIEGLTPEEGADLFGVGSVEELYELVILGLTSLDSNGDGWICSKGYPEQQNGTPAYYFNAVDNNARLH